MQQPTGDFRYLKVSGKKTGMHGLGRILSRMQQQGREPSETLAGELLEAAAKENYIPDSATESYATALLNEYRRQLGEVIMEDNQGEPSVKILGAGCTRCKNLTDNVRNCLQDLGVAAVVEHVTGLNEIASYGLHPTPVLVVNGKVVSRGKVLSGRKLSDLLSSSLGGESSS